MRNMLMPCFERANREHTRMRRERATRAQMMISFHAIITDIFDADYFYFDIR